MKSVTGRLLFLLLIPLLLTPDRSGATRRAPDVYPLLHQTLKGRNEPSDFARLGNYDVIEIGLWAIHAGDGHLDSLRALRTRKPELVTLIAMTTTMQCVNWNSDEIWNKQAWSDTVAAHADDWLLRDTDGDLWLLDGVELTCEGGRLNYYHHDMARAYARFVAEATVLRYPDVLDGIRLDDLQGSINYYNKWDNRRAPGVDSLDLNQDGQADTREQIAEWWGAGVDTFLVTLRDLVGPDVYITVNGYIPTEAFQWVNGRYHEGYPHEHGDGWEKAMTDSKKGYLGGDTLYSASPTRLSGLLTNNASAGYNYDPDCVSTKDAPYDHPGLPGYLRFTLASHLLGEGWYTMTGWGTAVDWKGDPIPWQYQTLWWFPVYDTLRTYLGTPVGDAVRDTVFYNRDRFVRDYTGGRVRVYPQLSRGILDLNPIASYGDDPPQAVTVGDTVPVRWSIFDPNGDNEPLDVVLRLSRDGGVSFPESLGSFSGKDTTVVWVADEPVLSCVFQVAATDTSGLMDTVASASFEVKIPTVTGDSRAEVQPGFWIANTPALFCTITVATTEGEGGGGWDRAAVILPETIGLLSFGGAEGEGGAIAATIETAGDTVRIDLEEKISGTRTIRFRFLVNAPPLPLVDSLRFAVAVDDRETPGGVVWLEAGDANGVPDDGNALAVTCDYGPPVELSVEPMEIVLAAGDSIRFAIDGFDQAGNVLEIIPVWSLSDTLGLVDSSGLLIALRPGSLEVAAAAAGLDAYAFVSILPGEPDSIRVEPESLTVAAGDTALFTAFVYDAVGNRVDGVTPVWTVEDTIAAIGQDGRLVAHRPGETRVFAAAAGGVEGSARLRIDAGAPAFIEIDPDHGSLTEGDTLRFHGEVRDIQLNLLDVEIEWEATDSLGSIDGTGLFTAVGAGMGWTRASAGGVTDSVPLAVHVSPLVGVLIDPADRTISADSILQLKLYGITAGADTISIAGTWSVLSGSGTIDEPGLFLPALAGPVEICAEAEGFRDTAHVTVQAGAPVVLRLEPDSLSAVAGDSLHVTTRIFDAQGNETEGTVAFSATGTCGGVIDTPFVCTNPGAGWIHGDLGGEAADSVFYRITAGSVATVSLSPESLSVLTGETFSFSATAADRYGNPVESLFDWSVEGGIGGIDGEGDFTASGPGEGLVIAAVGSVRDSSPVTVADSIPEEEEPEPDPEPVAVTARAAESPYTGADWPSPLLVFCEYRDESGFPFVTEEPESIGVTLRPIDPTVVSCETDFRVAFYTTLPETLSLPLDAFGGRGRVQILIEGREGMTAGEDTFHLATPDLNGDLLVDLDDAGLLFSAIDEGTAGGSADLNGDGIADEQDLAVLESAWDLGCGGAAGPDLFDGESPAWYAIGDAGGRCGDEPVSALFALDPGSVESIRAMEISFPTLGAMGREVEWTLSPVWGSPRVTELADGPDGPRILITSVPGPIASRVPELLELRVCGSSVEDFGGGKSYCRIIGSGAEASPPFETPILFQLDLEDTTSSRPDTIAGTEPPPVFALFPNRPNPFRGATTIRYTVPAAGGAVNLSVYNLNGEKVSVLRDEFTAAGSHALEWDGRDWRGKSLPAGVYFVRFRAPGMGVTKKITLLP